VAAARISRLRRPSSGLEHRDECQLGLVELPAGSQKSAVLVAVGIAEHDLLHAASAFEQAHVFRQTQQFVHHLAAMAQIIDCFEQRDDIEVEHSLARSQQTRFFQQHRGFENV